MPGVRIHAQSTRRLPLDASTLVFAVALLAIVVPCVGMFVLGAIVGVWHANGGADIGGDAVSWGAVWTTLAYSLIIGLLATLLALPAGWCVRTLPATWVGVMCVPMLMPSVLAYAGWGMLRGPGSVLGDWLGRAEAASPGVTIVTGKITAVLGLALWAWPLAAIAVGAAARGVPESLLDALRLEPATRVRRGIEILRLLVPGILAGIAVVAVVMLGSAVPLHLAQVQTLSIQLWKAMSLTPEPVRVWSGAWALLVVMAIAAALVPRCVCAKRDLAGGMRDTPRRGSRLVYVLAAVVWGLAVPAPMVLCAWSLKNLGSLNEFWRLNAWALVNSLQTAGFVGVLIAVTALALWWLGGSRHAWARGAAMCCAGVLTWSAILPGAMLGAAGTAVLSRSWCPTWIADTNAPVILAHVARFGVVGALVGLWLAGQEHTDERGARELFAPGVRGWATTRVRPGGWAMLAGVAITTGVMSVHEIEAAVVLTPPGPGNLALRLLELLHYARDEQLSAACINIFGLGTVVSIVGAWLIGVGCAIRVDTSKDVRRFD